MYKKTSKFYDALHHFLDYESASKKVHYIIQGLNSKAETLLDVACGTGKHLQFFKEHYLVEGLDLNGELLEIAGKRLNDVPLHQANMLDFNLKRSFDVITCLFGSIPFVKTVDNLNIAISKMAEHLKPGGILIIEPWVSLDKYWRSHVDANFVDQKDLKIAWMYKHAMEGTVAILNYNFLVGTPMGVDHFTERVELGLYTHEQYKDAFSQAGLHVDYDPVGLFNYGLYVSQKQEQIDA